uniref:uncharacterized protein n=1 Tax=Myxine glutinosa TaxID=7769 RepID=UPI00358E07DA
MLTYGPTFNEHVQQVRNVLLRCREHGITLNPQKFHFAQDSVKFCGSIINRDGVASDPGKLSAIADFPTPTNITDLRSFLGLVHQLDSFSTEISTASDPLRSLLKKGSVFDWTADHDSAFLATKRVLTSPPVLAHFNPS